MWLTNFVYNVALIKNNDMATMMNDIQDIQSKLRVLMSTDGNGSTLPGYEAPSSFASILGANETFEIIRIWNTEECAAEFVNFVQQYPWVTASYRAND
jgi:hypothetical protein